MKRDNESRREFLRGAARWLLAATAVGGVGALAAKRGRCAALNLCAECPIKNGCLTQRRKGPK